MNLRLQHLATTLVLAASAALVACGGVEETQADGEALRISRTIASTPKYFSRDTVIRNVTDYPVSRTIHVEGSSFVPGRQVVVFLYDTLAWSTSENYPSVLWAVVDGAGNFQTEEVVMEFACEQEVTAVTYEYNPVIGTYDALAPVRQTVLFGECLH